MNSRQRARWAAEIVAELQKLQKRSQGRSESPALARALAELAAARTLMLAEVSAGGETAVREEDDA